VAAINEMHRILRIGGRVLIYVWAYEQENKVFKTQDVFVAWHLQDKYEEESADKSSKTAVPEESKDEESKDSVSSSSFIETAIRAEDKKATVYHRYYHVFKENELEELINDNFSGRLEIKDCYYDHANWVVLCEKIA
jgi:alkylated DNA repair protein alkB homolog 8